MRTAFIETLFSLAECDERIWLLTGDLGFSVLERFARRFPDRFVNVGVAEQNMTGVAAGLALSGKIVFTYSIANFPVMRCLEQIRNDVCYHNANVKVVAVGGGLAYGSQGYTHFAVEDLAVMSAMPNMTVLAPADPVEARLATRAIVEWPGPCYLRLGKSGEKALHQKEPQFRIGKAITVRTGKDVALLTTGALLGNALTAARLLEAKGISASVVSFPTVKPLDVEAVRQVAESVKLIVTVEEHSAFGGLGSSVASVLAAQPSCPLRMACLDVETLLRSSTTGSQTHLLEKYGLSAGAIARRTEAWWQEAESR